jgi:chaperone modulatory protein CbpM
MIHTPILCGQILNEELELDWDTMARFCRLQLDELKAMVEVGLLEPRGELPEAWRFSGADLRRARAAGRLTRDLGVNVEGAALILELLEERRTLHRDVRVLQALLREI